MRRKKKSTIGVFNKFVLAINSVAVLLLLLSYLAPVIDPKTFWVFSFLGLAYPILLPINVLFIIYWVLAKPKFALISAIVVLMGGDFVLDNIGFRESSAIGVPKSSQKIIRVMTYNVHYFRRFNDKNDLLIKDQILEIINKEQPDVICLQEFMTHASGDYNNKKALKKILDTEYLYFVPNLDNSYESSGLAIFSKFPITKKGSIIFKNTSRGNEAIYADILYKNKPIRLYNVHLQSISFQREDYEYLEKVKEIETNVQSSRRIGSMLKTAFLKRSEQVEELKKHTLSSKSPVVICGDFNDTPVSYAVHTMSKGMKNAFREKGSGPGITYNGEFPNFQIDYILTSKEFDIKSYRVINKKLSDHYGVRSDIELQ